MDSYVKGRRYYSHYVDLNDVGKIKDGYYYKFSVESERTYRHYKVEFKIKGFEITDYKLNGKGGVTSVTYKLTYKDGSVIEKTCNFDEPIDDDSYIVIDTVDGNDIKLGVFAWSTDEYGIQSWIGYEIWDLYVELEGDIVDFCDCRCHKDGILNNIVYNFLCRIWQIFRIKEYCQCGIYHW